MTADDWTFGLALVGYGLLATDFVRLHTHRASRPLSAATASVVLVHVVCVWALRFGWSLAAMLEKGVAGFVLFHGALALVALAPLVGERARRLVVSVAFVLVSAGALPAPLRYPELALATLPLFAVFVVAVAQVTAARLRRRRASDS